MARKKKIKPIEKLWEVDDIALRALVAHLEGSYPTSGQLATFQREIARRASGGPIPEIQG